MKAPEMISAKDIKYDLGLGKKPEGMEAKIRLILEKLAKLKPARVVVDSVSSLTLEDGLNARGLSRLLIEGLNNVKATTLITGEALNGSYPDEVTPFLSDGVIILSLDALGSQIARSLVIQKMRMTDYGAGVSNLEIIAGKGVKVEPTR
jgi:KaiC/GvpD/RAD55 family RecA-like ATPase